MNPLIADPPSPRPADPLASLQGNPHLVAIAQYDPEMAVALSQLLDYLEDADFQAAHITCQRIDRLIWKHVCATHEVAQQLERELAGKEQS